MKTFFIRRSPITLLQRLLVLATLSFCACGDTDSPIGAGPPDGGVHVGADASTRVEHDGGGSATEADASLCLVPGAGAAEPSPSQLPSMACNCTRRAGGKVSFNCPAGVGEAVSVQVGPAGGRVELVGQQGRKSGLGTALIIPPTALAKMVTITITETAEALPSDFADLSPLYRFDPPDLTFALPVEVRLPIGNGSGTYGQVAMYWSSGTPGVFERVADSYLNAGFLQGSTMKLGSAFGGVPACSVPLSCRPEVAR